MGHCNLAPKVSVLEQDTNYWTCPSLRTSLTIKKAMYKFQSLFPHTAVNSCTFVSFIQSRRGSFYLSSGQNPISTLVKCLLNCLFGVFTPLSFVLYCSLRKTTSTHFYKPQTSGFSLKYITIHDLFAE